MKVLIIDSNNLMHRAMHAYKGLTNNVKPSSIVYGMGMLTNHMIKQFRPDKVYMCWDFERSPYRLKLHPEYKQGRKTKTEEERAAMKDQMRSSMKMFNALGIHQLYGKGMEADDWVYILTRKHENDFVTIVSSDKDFNQLLGNRLKIWNPNKNLLIGKHNVKAHFGYSEKECLDYLILDGDSSDNIPGYRGMGEQNIKIFLAEHGSIRNFLEDESLEFKRLDRVKLKEVYKKNRILIGLKQFYLKYLKDKTLDFYNPKPSFNKAVLLKICKEYNIKMFLKKEFTQTFKNL